MVFTASKVKHDPPKDVSSWTWAGLCRFFLEPLGLWVTQRSLNANGALPNRFPRIADFVTSDPDHLATVYKKFDGPSCRNLLLLEARVAALERFQHQLDDEDITNIQRPGINFSVTAAPQSFEYFAYLAHKDRNPNESEMPASVLHQWGKVMFEDYEAILEKRHENDPLLSSLRDNYFETRWDVAKALQVALKEYRRDS